MTCLRSNLDPSTSCTSRAGGCIHTSRPLSGTERSQRGFTHCASHLRRRDASSQFLDCTSGNVDLPRFDALRAGEARFAVRHSGAELRP